MIRGGRSELKKVKDKIYYNIWIQGFPNQGSPTTLRQANFIETRSDAIVQEPDKYNLSIGVFNLSIKYAIHAAWSYFGIPIIISGTINQQNCSSIFCLEVVLIRT